MTAATRLVQLVINSGATLRVRKEPVDDSTELVPFVYITVPNVGTVDVRCDLARRWLDHLHYADTKTVASGATIDRTVDQLRAIALFGNGPTA